jgi:hypothetical protein
LFGICARYAPVEQAAINVRIDELHERHSARVVGWATTELEEKSRRRPLYYILVWGFHLGGVRGEF